MWKLPANFLITYKTSLNSLSESRPAILFYTTIYLHRPPPYLQRDMDTHNYNLLLFLLSLQYPSKRVEQLVSNV